MRVLCCRDTGGAPSASLEAGLILAALSRLPPSAPWALKSVKAFATTHMGTKDVRVDPKLNQAIWGQGIKNVPKRLRIRLERKRNDEEGAKERLYTLATVVPGVTDFKVRPSLLSCVLRPRPPAVLTSCCTPRLVPFLSSRASRPSSSTPSNSLLPLANPQALQRS